MEGRKTMTDKIFNWEEIKDRLELVTRNKETVKENEVWFPLCGGEDTDIVGVFKIKIDDKASVIVNKEILNIWGKTPAEVVNMATYNCMTKYTPSVALLSISEDGVPSLDFLSIPTELSKINLTSAPYLTITYKDTYPNGATAAFLGVLNDISDVYNDGEDLLLIFTSIHECMCHRIKDEEYLDGILEAQVTTYNYLREDEILTNRPYVYDHKAHTIVTYDYYKKLKEVQNGLN